MKAFFCKYRKLHIWLLASLGLIAAWWFGRHCRPVMNFLADHVTHPLRAALGRVCFLVDFSVMEVLLAGLVVWAVVYLVRAVVRVVREKGRRRSRVYRCVLFVLCVVLTICDGFCLLWGVNFWTDGFQEQSGIYAEPVAVEDLLQVTVHFAQQLPEAADVAVEEAADDYFAVSQINRQRARDEAIAVLQDVVDGAANLSDVQSEALLQISQIAEDIENEAAIESLVRGKGFSDCVAVISGDAANVIVRSSALLPNEVAQIQEIVYETAGILPANVKIIEK